MITHPPSPTMVRIASAESADISDVMTIMTAAFDPRFGEAWTRSQCAGILPMSGVSLMLARDREGRPVGFSLFRMVADEAELLLIAVDPDHHRRGIGRLLLNEFMDGARRGGVHRLHLEVREGNPAVQMYLDAGFSTVGRRRNYYRGDEGSQFDAITLAKNV
jgi:[ribosomal protein S18]-alanine N-acetyltransferase